MRLKSRVVAIKFHRLMMTWLARTQQTLQSFFVACCKEALITHHIPHMNSFVLRRRHEAYKLHTKDYTLWQANDDATECRIEKKGETDYIRSRFFIIMWKNMNQIKLLNFNFLLCVLVVVFRNLLDYIGRICSFVQVYKYYVTSI